MAKINKITYCLGELVHNTQVTKELEKKGIIFIDNINKAENNVIIRAHGTQKQIYEQAEEKQIKIIDLTCPKVLHIHNIVEEYSKNNYFIFLVGKAEHPETIGTASFCENGYYIIEKIEDAEKAVEEFKKANNKKGLIISQTTFSLEKFEAIVEKIQILVPGNIEVKNTICNATKERQKETEEIAKQVEQMIILGGKHSSNSNKLYEIAKKHCQNVLFIETEQEIDKNKIKTKNKIGIMAGASTPEKSIQKVVEKIRNL